MSASTRKFTRPGEARVYRPIFHIFPEGSKTEVGYFNMLKQELLSPLINLDLKNHKTQTDPIHILKRVEKFIRSEKLQKNDELWIVIDVADWKKEELKILKDWESKQCNYCLAFSNPHFEYWLLLHFESGDNISSKHECEQRLRINMPNYKKNSLDKKKLKEKVPEAIQNAKKRYEIVSNDTVHDWYHDIYSTVFKLVEKMI